MTDDDRLRHARSFGSAATAYDRGRPSYPREAADWLIGRDAAVVLELGAGTGKLTEVLVAAGHDVHATDPDVDMLAVLHERLPAVRASVGAAEEIPAADQSVDVVVAAQSFHWFDPARALPEIARVLKPGGWLAVVWNTRDERIPWVRRLGRVIDNPYDRPRDPEVALAESGLFGPVEQQVFGHWQTINRASVLDLVASRSHVALLDDEARQAKLAEVLAFYDDFGRGMDGMQLPYRVECYRAPVLAAARPNGGTSDGSASGSGSGSGSGEATGPIVVDPPTDGDDLLLIDFR